MLAHSLARRAQVEACPDDAAAAGGGLGAPAVRAGECFDHVEAARAAVWLPAAPRAAEVFGLDPDVTRVQLGADGEAPGPAARVQYGVSRQLGRDEDGVVDGRASGQVAGDGAADVMQLVGLAWVAGACPGLKVGTTMLLPGRNLVWLAKAVGTLDQLSGGRFLLTFVPGLALGGERSAIGIPAPERGVLWTMRCRC